MKALNRLTMAVAVATASLAAIPASYAADCELLVWEDIQKSKGITDAVAAFEQETKCKVSIQEMPYVQQIEKNKAAKQLEARKKPPKKKPES